MRLLLAAALLVSVPASVVAFAPAAASSSQAWAQGMTEARAACRKASELDNAATLGQPLLFSDTAGKTAILVTGSWRPKHMKGAKATMLCLYDRKTRTAEAQEAPKWTVAR